MHILTKQCRWLFPIAMFVFGIQHLLHASSLGRAAGPPWFPVSRVIAGLIGAILIAAGVTILASSKGSWGAAALSILFLAHAVFDLRGLASHPRDPGRWTSISELVALAGGALVLAGYLRGETSSGKAPGGSLSPAVKLGNLLFALTLIVFGIQHFLYARFIATLIPRWIPAHIYCSYFIGVVFLAAALSILAHIQARLTATLLGIMFLLWFAILHAPRVFAARTNANEWTSAFVALAMCASAFALASALPETD